MKITEYIKNNILYLDGGMGTLLQSEGLRAGELPEAWNITRPEIITGIHRAYYDAGSNVVNTNTFGANILKFSEDELDAVVRAAIENARRAASESRGTQEKWVALDIGPTGKMLRPYGDLDFEDAVGIFAKTVKLGVDINNLPDGTFCEAYCKLMCQIRERYPQCKVVCLIGDYLNQAIEQSILQMAAHYGAKTVNFFRVNGFNDLGGYSPTSLENKGSQPNMPKHDYSGETGGCHPGSEAMAFMAT